MSATLTLCASRKMLDLSDMVGVWAGLGGGEGARGRGGVIQAVQIQPLVITIIRSVSNTRTSLMYPMRTSCTQVAGGTLASDVFEADRAGVP